MSGPPERAGPITGRTSRTPTVGPGTQTAGPTPLLILRRMTHAYL